MDEKEFKELKALMDNWVTTVSHRQKEIEKIINKMLILFEILNKQLWTMTNLIEKVRKK